MIRRMTWGDVNNLASAWGGAFQAFAALLIGWLTFLILTRQSVDAEHKTRLELYEKRLSIYRAIYDYVIVETDEPTYSAPDRDAAAERAKRYFAAFYDAQFLLRPKIVKHLEAMKWGLIRFQTLAEFYGDIIPAEGYEDEAKASGELAEAEQLRTLLRERAAGLQKLFMPYLGFHNVGLADSSAMSRLSKAMMKTAVITIRSLPTWPRRLGEAWEKIIADMERVKKV